MRGDFLMSIMNVRPIWFKRIMFCILIFVIIAIVFFLFIYPLLAPSIFPSSPVTDINSYKNEIYLKNEYGTEFKRYLSSFDYLENGKVVGFYYADNYKYDSIVYGKIPDIIAVDIKLDDESYEMLKNSKTVKEYQHYEYYITQDSDCYEFYFPSNFSENHFQTFFSLNDHDRIFRGVIVTDTEDFEFLAPSFILTSDL